MQTCNCIIPTLGQGCTGCPNNDNYGRLHFAPTIPTKIMTDDERNKLLVFLYAKIRSACEEEEKKWKEVK